MSDASVHERLRRRVDRHGINAGNGIDVQPMANSYSAPATLSSGRAFTQFAQGHRLLGPARRSRHRSHCIRQTSGRSASAHLVKGTLPGLREVVTELQLLGHLADLPQPLLEQARSPAGSTALHRGMLRERANRMVLTTKLDSFSRKRWISRFGEALENAAAAARPHRVAFRMYGSIDTDLYRREQHRRYRGMAELARTDPYAAKLFDKSHLWLDAFCPTACWTCCWSTP